MAESQTYATHRRWVPHFHFFVLPVLAINVIVQIVVVVRNFTLGGVWNVVVGLALAAFAYATRVMATTAQDRVIRLEETLRLQRILPADLRGRIGELSTGQLIGLRFSSDAELPELTVAVLS